MSDITIRMNNDDNCKERQMRHAMVCFNGYLIDLFVCYNGSLGMTIERKVVNPSWRQMDMPSIDVFVEFDKNGTPTLSKSSCGL